ncbi:hypothetical protein ACFO1B_20380 [Dactylosporangium siamense]|uniref:MmyB family transcriptional regulator n=1 Tax=Dactylosporangium siamense TaxID=685454 RepID=UPI001EF279CD
MVDTRSSGRAAGDEQGSGGGEQARGAQGGVGDRGRLKIFRHAGLGDLRLATQSMQLAGTPELRMIVYTPADAPTATALATLDTPLTGCEKHRTTD